MTSTYITPALAKRLDLNNNMLFVRSAFYLGMGTTSILEHIRSPLLKREVEIIIETARKLGMNESDSVEIDYEHL